MDTPESDVSAIQNGTMEPLPLYTEEEGVLDRTQILIANLSISRTSSVNPFDPVILYSFVDAQSSPPPIEVDAKATTPTANPLPEPIMEFPGELYGSRPDDLSCVKQAIVMSFFAAIGKGNGEAVSLFIMNRLVSANTKDAYGKTPLLAAVATRDVQLVKLLVELGADPDAYGVASHSGIYYGAGATTRDPHLVHRTPLQLAASIGNLPLVKLFLETYHCSDASIAPDGQIALRLAAANGHRDIVDYLPARRGGGFRRWKHQHDKAIRRTKNAAKKIARVGKFFLWDVEKFLLWSVPKHVIVKPVVKSCKYCWEQRKLAGLWCAHQLSAMPGRISRAAAEVWKATKKVPKGLWWILTHEIPRLIKQLALSAWKLLTVHLPNAITALAKWTWRLLTSRIPHAIAIAAKWLWAGISAAGRATLHVILRLVSLAHTLLVAIATFFRALSLADVYNGLVSVLHAVLVAFPRTLGSWLSTFWDVSYDVMKAAFGVVGEVLWWVVVALGWLVMYVPGKLWVMLCSMGGSVANAWWEVLVFFRPKA